MKIILFIFITLLSFNIQADLKNVFGVSYYDSLYFNHDLDEINREDFEEYDLDKYQIGLSWYLFFENKKSSLVGLSIKAKYDWFNSESDKLLIQKYDFGLTVLSIDQQKGGYTFRITLAPSIIFGNYYKNSNNYVSKYSDNSSSFDYGFTIEFGFGYALIFSDNSFVVGELGFSCNFNNNFPYIGLVTSIML